MRHYGGEDHERKIDTVNCCTVYTCGRGYTKASSVAWRMEKGQSAQVDRQAPAKYLLVALEIYHLPTRRRCVSLRVEPPLAKYVSRVVRVRWAHNYPFEVARINFHIHFRI